VCCSQDASDVEDKGNDLKDSPAIGKLPLNGGSVTDYKKVFNEKAPLRLEGSKIVRFEDGSKKQELNYENGKKNGVFQRWYSNGQLEKKGSYKDDRFDGFFEAWNEEGVRKWTGFYRDGKQHGEWTLFDKSGNPMPAIYFKDGIETTHDLPAFR
jgi:antitoxin component YwqK of YwqJK toxin-antitoxin module